MLIDIIGIILGISLMLYWILGGADFGAGIVELFVGGDSKRYVSKALAPVWEANHIWLIIAIVILFVGFPKAYALITLYLHIPLMLVLLGIILRGTAFTFRHYDAFKDDSQEIYSYIFRYSSVFTVFFLGVIIGALVAGKFPTDLNLSFFAVYVAPWMNVFSFSVGLFMVAMSAYIACVFLIGEVDSNVDFFELLSFSKRVFLGAILSGILIFFSSHWTDLNFHDLFFSNAISFVLAVVVTLLSPFVYMNIKGNNVWTTRILVSAQLVMIALAWFLIQWPNLIVFSDGSTVSLISSAAPQAVLAMLLIVLVVGLMLIIPLLIYLYGVFKRVE